MEAALVVGMISPSMYYQTSYSWLFLLHTRQVSWLKVQRLRQSSRFASVTYLPKLPYHSDEFVQDLHLFPFSPERQIACLPAPYAYLAVMAIMNGLYYISCLFTSIFYHLRDWGHNFLLQKKCQTAWHFRARKRLSTPQPSLGLPLLLQSE